MGKLMWKTFPNNQTHLTPEAEHTSGDLYLKNYQAIIRPKFG